MVLGMYKVYRKIILACLLLIVAGTVCGQRVTQTINDGWKFSLFEGDASTADFDVSGWTDVSRRFHSLILGMQKMQKMKSPVISGEKAGTGKP